MGQRRLADRGALGLPVSAPTDCDPGVERELAVSPRLATLLPVPIPFPTFVGQPSDRYPWPFFGAPLLHGRESADADLADEDRIELGGALGGSCVHCTPLRRG
jgi:aminoglycoside phosphotransferase (APT) family kinase protein